MLGAGGDSRVDHGVSKRTTRPENLYSPTQRRLPWMARRLGQKSDDWLIPGSMSSALAAPIKVSGSCPATASFQLRQAWTRLKPKSTR